MNGNSLLSGLHILVVEDVFLIAMDLRDHLVNSGCEVIGPASSVEQALDQIEGVSLDGAILDVNLNGERSFPIAELLASRDVPFLFLSGYDSASVFPEEFQDYPRLTKPVDPKVLMQAIAQFRRGGS